MLLLSLVERSKSQGRGSKNSEDSFIRGKVVLDGGFRNAHQVSKSSATLQSTERTGDLIFGFNDSEVSL